MATTAGNIRYRKPATLLSYTQQEYGTHQKTQPNQRL
jgi:hypothetical protein